VDTLLADTHLKTILPVTTIETATQVIQDILLRTTAVDFLNLNTFLVDMLHMQIIWAHLLLHTKVLSQTSLILQTTQAIHLNKADILPTITHPIKYYI
jgi:hypothetical protein